MREVEGSFVQWMSNLPWMLAALALAVAACGGDDGQSGTGQPGTTSANAGGGSGGELGSAGGMGGMGRMGDMGGMGRMGGGGGSDIPSLVQRLSTMLGANAWERVQSTWVDAAGDIYLCGSTKSAAFPTTAGAYDETYNGSTDNDAWVAKLSSNGKQLLWSTFLSGAERDDCYGIMTDAAGFVYVTGWTRSTDFPTKSAYDTTHNGDFDIFVAKLDPSATGAAQLVFSTYIGGSDSDQCRGSMAVGAGGEVYFSGYTRSTAFPTTAGAVQSTFQGGYSDAVVGRLSADGTSLDYSTYLGTTGPDHAFSGVWLNTDGSLSVVGLAGATGFPVTNNAYQSSYAGDTSGSLWFGDMFATRMTIGVQTATVHFATYLGGSGNDKAMGQHAMTGSDDGIYLYATTDSTDLPTTAGAYQGSLVGSNANLYVAKLSYDGSALVAATYLGGDATGYEPSGIKRTASGRVLLGGSIFGNVVFPMTADAQQPIPGGGNEGFFAVLSPDLSDLAYSTFVGGSADDRVRDVALRGMEGAVVVGDSLSSDFPTTADVYQTAPAGDNDGHVSVYQPSP